MLTMTTLLKPGDLGVDYSYARPGAKHIARAGAKFVLRYSAGSASSPSNSSHSLNAGKLITPKEFDEILGAGLDIIANDEWFEDRVTEGQDAGLADGAAAARLWKACGLEQGAAIYVSWDAAPVQSQWLGATSYLAGYETAIHDVNGYLVAAYAGTPFLRHAMHINVISFGWRPNAGSWSNDGLPYQPSTGRPKQRAALVKRALHATPAHIWQTGNYWFGKTCDENMIVRTPVGSHLETVASHHHHPHPKPPPKPPAKHGAHRVISDNEKHELTVSNDAELLIDGKPVAAIAKGA